MNKMSLCFEWFLPMVWYMTVLTVLVLKIDKCFVAIWFLLFVLFFDGGGVGLFLIVSLG